MLSLARISKQFCEKQPLTFFNYAHYTDIIIIIHGQKSTCEINKL